MKIAMRSQPQDEISWKFGPFRLEPAELLCDGKPVPVEKRHIIVLRLLVQNSPKVVTYDQFLKAWGRNVENNNVNGSIGVLRKILSIDPSQHYIETIHGIGFKFMVSPSKVTDPPPADADVTIDSNLLKHLNALRMQCIKKDVPFRTTNAMLTLLDMTSGFTEKAFNAVTPGFGTSLRERLRLFSIETQPYVDREKGLRYKDVDWFEFEYMQRAAAEARTDGSPLIIEKHLLLGILQSTSSNWVKWLRAQMSERDFDALIALLRADTGTPISENSIL